MAYPDGGLYNPVALTFDPSFNSKDFSKPIKHFKYPVLDDVKRPESDDDLAFMKVRRCNPPAIFTFLVGLALYSQILEDSMEISVHYAYFVTLRIRLLDSAPDHLFRKVIFFQWMYQLTHQFSYQVLQLGSLIKSKQVTSVELVKLYIGRLKK